MKEKFWWCDVDSVDAMSKKRIPQTEEVCDEKERLKGSRQHISPEFWYALDEKWGFDRSHVFDSVPEPADNESVRMELEGGIEIARSWQPQCAICLQVRALRRHEIFGVV